MSQAYLPGDTRQRIQDLIKDSSITQAERRVDGGITPSAPHRIPDVRLSRIRLFARLIIRITAHRYLRMF